MGIRTPLSEEIGIEIPFMQAGMGGIGPITLARLAAAISEAGALGTIAQPALVLEEPGISGDELEEQIGQVVEQVRDGIRLAVSLTDRPLAINVRIAQEQPDAEHVIRAILDERERDPKVRAQLRVLTTSGGHPRTYGLNGDIRDSGMLHFHAVHPLGAQLGYVGSRFLASEESEYHEANKRFIVEASETQTEVVPAFFGPARFIENGFTEEVKALVASETPTLERMRIEGAAMRRGALEGDMETGMMIGGQGIGRIREVLPAGEIVRQIAREAEDALARAGTLLATPTSA